jgi:HEAT repeat protein
MNNSNLTAEQWVERLSLAAKQSHGVSQAKGKALQPVRTRGAVASRPLSTQLQDVISGLMRQSKEIRQEVISVLCQKTDEVTASVLTELLRKEPEWRLRKNIVTGIGGSGGKAAIDVLMEAAERDPEEQVQVSAIQTLGALALKAHPELRPKNRAVRVRGAIRTRGVSVSKKVSPKAEEILHLLDRIRTQELSRDVRNTADEVLGQLDE